MRPSITMCALTLGLWLPVSASSAQQPADNRLVGDTLYLTRKQAIVLALRANPQIDIVREQLYQARAQRVQAIAIADPVLAASADSINSIRSIRSAPQRPIALTGGIPFPDKLRLRGRVAPGAFVQFERHERLTVNRHHVAFPASYDRTRPPRRGAAG